MFRVRSLELWLKFWHRYLAQVDTNGFRRFVGGFVRLFVIKVDALWSLGFCVGGDILMELVFQPCFVSYPLDFFNNLNHFLNLFFCFCFDHYKQHCIVLEETPAIVGIVIDATLIFHCDLVQLTSYCLHFSDAVHPGLRVWLRR